MTTSDTPGPDIQRWQRRVQRERRAREQAEELLEAKSRELYGVNQALSLLASELEQRVEQRTRELATARERAVTLARYDQLTGVANRFSFGQVLEKTIDRCQATGTPFALLLIDLDDFKQINDTFGHEAGDVVLRHAAKCFNVASGPNNFLARLGGDEFAAIVLGTDSAPDLGLIAQKMLAAGREPIVYRDQLLEISCSIGLAVYPVDATDATDLQRHADLALYKSKSLGAGRHTHFEAAMKTEVDERHSLGVDLKPAIKSESLVPWFQSVVDSTTNEVIGVEALARWHHPVRGLLDPDVFIKIAEERGLINDLFTRMLHAACLSAKPWIESGAIRYMSINVSPSQFRSGSLPDLIFGVIAEIGFPASALVVEITEELLLLDLDRARVQLDHLAKGGIRISLDDFGIGYSNIAYLRRLPINTIKLDRLLTIDVCKDSKARSVIAAIVEIARALNLDLVAEGVETKAQALWLSRLGCRYLQGYLFNKPMSEEDFDMAYCRGKERRLQING